LLLALLAAFTLLPGPKPARAEPTLPGDRPLVRAEIPDRRVALTFDVTWQQTELARIIGALDAANVKATFFVGGTFLSLYGENARLLIAHGHEVGTLGQRVVDLSGQSEQEVTSNLLASQSALAKILGGPVRYFRPPMGTATPEVVRGARAANLITVTYSLDSEDYTGIPAAEIAQNVVKRARKGDIIRLSASDWSPRTSAALPLIIRGLAERKFLLVRVSDLVVP
jgi:peptidoglycan/xylan/chitin deacetylase (PgdA/CDA1 family)